MEDITKTRRQKKALTYWKDNGYKGTLNLTMRFGKTRCAKMAIEHFIRETPNRCKTIIIVPNTVTKNNMLNELKDVPNVRVATIYELMKHPKFEQYFVQTYDFLIIDEIQKFIRIGTNSNKIVANIIPLFDRVLALSGSTFTTAEQHYMSHIGIPICDRITEAEAIANKWISNYEEYNLAIPLEDHIKEAYAKASDYIADTIDIFKNSHVRLNNVLKTPIFKSDFDVILSCFLGRNAPTLKTFIKPTTLRNILAEIMGWKKDLDLSIEYNQARDMYWNPVAIYERAKVFKNTVKSRNDLLINNRSKLQAVIDIIETNSVPTICFNESTEMADLEAEYFSIDGIAYHSNIESRPIINPSTNQYYKKVNGEPKLFGKKGLLNLAIEGVKSGVYRYIFTAKALNEGITIENINQIIITAGDINPKTQEQRSARGKNIDVTNFNKNCIVINLYIDDFEYNDRLILSRDKQKLIQRQLNTPNVKWVDSISDIFNSPV